MPQSSRAVTVRPWTSSGGSPANASCDSHDARWIQLLLRQMPATKLGAVVLSRRSCREPAPRRRARGGAGCRRSGAKSSRVVAGAQRVPRCREPLGRWSARPSRPAAARGGADDRPRTICRACPPHHSYFRLRRGSAAVAISILSASGFSRWASQAALNPLGTLSDLRSDES